MAAYDTSRLYRFSRPLPPIEDDAPDQDGAPGGVDAPIRRAEDDTSRTRDS